MIDIKDIISMFYFVVTYLMRLPLSYDLFCDVLLPRVCALCFPSFRICDLQSDGSCGGVPCDAFLPYRRIPKSKNNAIILQLKD